MPIVYRCRRCGRVLFVAVEINRVLLGPADKRAKWRTVRIVRYADLPYPTVMDYDSIPTPAAVAEHFNYRCPFCGAPLNPHKTEIKIFVSPKRNKKRR